jgi:hypothetical protein
MQKKASFRIFVVHHCQLNDDYYQASMLDYLTFINVSSNPILVNERYKTLRLTEFRNFKPLGKWYTESEVMYNLYYNQDLYSDVDYIGFIQYDMDSSGIDGQTIQKLLQEEDRDLILFQPFTFRQDYNQKILMDPERPNTLQGEGLNCYETIFADYNAYYKENHQTQNFNEQVIGLCSAFLMRTSLFNEMMEFAVSIVESGKLDRFDTNHQYRIQGGLLERYYAAWLLLKKKHFNTISLPHSFDGSHAQMSFYVRLRLVLYKTAKAFWKQKA